ncbi:adenosylcobinamide-phosphate synthase CbiB [Ureibacillus sp. NPDC094379]
MHILAVILGQLLDLIIGDPPKWPHPIRWIGTFIAWLTKKLNKGDYRFYKGMFLAIIVISTVTLTTLAIVYAAYQIHIVAGFIVETILIAIGLAQKSLKEAAMVVYDALKAGDMKEARTKLSWIVGRDTADLEEPEIVRGVVETVSENTSDGITAPLFYAILFGAPGLWAYKAINTLDSMVGYKNEKYRQFGTVSARLDDVANFIPSRITGLLILLFTKNKTNRTLLKRMKLWLIDAKKHPSPNSGYLEAATSYQLGIRLGGYNTYHGVTSFRAYMGKPDEELRSIHIKDTIQQMTIVSLIFTLLVGGVTLAISFPWR